MAKDKSWDWFSRGALVGSLILALCNAVFQLDQRPEDNLFGAASPWVLVGLVALVILWLWRKL
jgi:hypothetical protein